MEGNFITPFMSASRTERELQREAFERGREGKQGE